MQFRTKQDQVAEVLRERIIAGSYGRGQKLKQLDIANELGISVTPVREALRILEAEGYVVNHSHRGVLVPHFSIEKAEELFDLRIMLEGDLTRLALQNMDSAEIAELCNFHQRYVEAKGDIDRRRANYRFHFHLYEMAERPQTMQFVRVIWAKYPFPYHEMMQDPGPRVEKEHEAFLRCVQDHDHDGAVAAMKAHIRSGWNEFVRYWNTAEQPHAHTPRV